MSELLETGKIDTPAGVYTVTWYYDPDTSQPEDEGFGMVRASVTVAAWTSSPTMITTSRR